MERFKLNKKLFDSGKNVELSYPSNRPHCCATFPSGLPVNVQKLKHLHLTGKFGDVNIYIEGHGLVAQQDKIILSLWSVPFAKIFTNGMSETMSTEVLLRDVSPEAFKAMLEFKHSGELDMQGIMASGSLLLQLLFLSDQFGVTLLHQECCKTLLECLSEDSVCPILQLVTSIPSAKLIQETGERKFAMHFDYCTTASIDFILLDETTFSNIIQRGKMLQKWSMVTSLKSGKSDDGELFEERLQPVRDFLSFVRFPLLPISFLKKLEKSSISRHIHEFGIYVVEAISYLEYGFVRPEDGHNVRFQHRRSSYKELQYICDGDSNEVLYFAGTSYGEHQWVNPVLSKRIGIAASSPPSRYTDPKVLVSRTYQGTSFAGRRMEDGRNYAWWAVDIGEEHQLLCNYYTLRQDGSRAYTIYWNLQGSLDEKALDKLEST
ncbi:hypothetical protein CJ030_MR1G023912 [Morella rubra]|uniref:BTB domain-containing protein n=1 Tax=Morella rubra TaxID=262757 RepID=A0A6A1WLF6_9ROSI|nr:hypothetical protein CJ030_MR1G023912 [Morella rubra]